MIVKGIKRAGAVAGKVVDAEDRKFLGAILGAAAAVVGVGLMIVLAAAAVGLGAGLFWRLFELARG